MSQNQQIVVVERPRYIVPTSNCFRLVDSSMPRDPEEGEVLVQTEWLAMESVLYARVKRVNAIQRDPIPLRQPMAGSAIGVVRASGHPRFKPGDRVSGAWGWQQFALVSGNRLRNLDFGPQRPSYALGAYGLSGFAAYVALELIAPPGEGETVVVGTALGGLGHLAGQIAKLKGCRVVGIAGNAEKCQLAVEKLGFDDCINRNARDFRERLRGACRNGIDVYVETLGAAVLDAVMPLMKVNSRIAACGQVSLGTIGHDRNSQYGRTANYLGDIIAKRITVRGMIASDHVRGRVRVFDQQMKAWIDEKKIKPMEDIVEGLENAPDAFQGVFQGENRGNRLVRIAEIPA